jgi:hypothetical protein
MEAFRTRQEMDARIGRALRDVPMPEDLERRLLGALTVSAAASVSPELPQPARSAGSAERETAGRDLSSQSQRRRQMRAAAVVAAASLLIAAAVWFAVEGRSQGTLTLTQVGETVPLSTEGLPAFDGNFEAPLPRAWKGSRRLGIGRPKGWTYSSGDRHEAALYPFSVRAGNTSASGVLLVVPAGKMRSVPQDSYFQAANVTYIGRSAQVAWTANGLVYVCFVKNGEAAELVARALEVAPA